MAAEDEFKINIVTTANVAGANEAAKANENVAASTDKVAIAARKATEADKEYNRQLTESALASVSRPEEINEAEQRRNELLQTRRAILEGELELLQAEKAGNMEKVGQLTEELEVQREILAIRRSSNVSEEEAVGMATERVALERELAVQAAARRAQERAQQIAQREEEQAGRVFGRGGRLGQLSRNFGADQNMGASIGIGAFAGYEVSRGIDEVISKLEEERIALQRNTDELLKQVKAWSEMSQNVSGPADVVKLTKGMTASLEELRAKAEETKVAPASFWEKVKADAGATVEWLNGISDKLSGIQSSEALDSIREKQGKAFQTQGEKQKEELEKQIDREQATQDAIFRTAKKHSDEMQAIRNLEGDAQQAKLEDMIEQERALRDAQDLRSHDGILGWVENQKHIDEYQKALDEVMSKEERLASEQKRHAEEARRQKEETEKQRNRLDLQALDEKLKGLAQSPEDAAAAQRDLADEARMRPGERHGRDLDRTPEERSRNRIFEEREKLLREKAALEYQQAGRLRDPLEREAAQNRIRDEEQRRRFEQLPPEQQATAAARDAARGQASNGTAIGSAAKALEDASKLAEKDGSADHLQRLMAAVAALATAMHEKGKDTSRIDERLRQIEHTVEQVQGQVKNNLQ